MLCLTLNPTAAFRVPLNTVLSFWSCFWKDLVTGGYEWYFTLTFYFRHVNLVRYCRLKTGNGRLDRHFMNKGTGFRAAKPSKSRNSFTHPSLVSLPRHILFSYGMWGKGQSVSSVHLGMTSFAREWANLSLCVQPVQTLSWKGAKYSFLEPLETL